MKTLRRDDCSVLPLVLKGKWYDLIASGEKKEEYRDDKMFWHTRIGGWRIRSIPDRKDWIDIVIDGSKSLVVAFSRGYRKPDMFFEVKTIIEPETWIPERKPHPEWGEPETPHYIIRLSARVELT